MLIFDNKLFENGSLTLIIILFQMVKLLYIFFVQFILKTNFQHFIQTLIYKKYTFLNLLVERLQLSILLLFKDDLSPHELTMNRSRSNFRYYQNKIGNKVEKNDIPNDENIEQESVCTFA